jgi:F-type H+-transporting ATPase subunit gamma
MANPRVLVKRRKAVRNIRKITRTMELIATARFKAAQTRAQQAEAYTRKIGELAAELGASLTDVSHPLLKKREEVKSSLLLVICSNRGLCGGYNAGILREANARIRHLGVEGVQLHLELSGKRAITYYRYQGRKAEHQFTHFEDKPRFHDVEELADRYLAAFIGGQVDQVEVAYMKYLSGSRQEPVVETLLPLDRASPERVGQPRQASTQEPKKPVQYEFLPDAAGILEELLPISFKVRLFKCFLDAAVSEQIARRVTMKQATENADDMIKNLTRMYNRARQSRITTEILEVIGGAEALK